MVLPVCFKCERVAFLFEKGLPLVSSRKVSNPTKPIEVCVSGEAHAIEIGLFLAHIKKSIKAGYCSFRIDAKPFVDDDPRINAHTRPHPPIVVLHLDKIGAV